MTETDDGRALWRFLKALRQTALTKRGQDLLEVLQQQVSPQDTALWLLQLLAHPETLKEYFGRSDLQNKLREARIYTISPEADSRAILRAALFALEQIFNTRNLAGLVDRVAAEKN